MKTKHFFLLLTLFSFNAIFSQYGGYGNGYGRNAYGNGIGGSSMGQPSAREYIEKEPPIEVTVKKIIDKMKKEINLDDLQEIAISNTFTENLKEQSVIIKREMNQDDKIKELQAINEVTNRKVMEFLDKEQKEKYKNLINQSQNQRK